MKIPKCCNQFMELKTSIFVPDDFREFYFQCKKCGKVKEVTIFED